MTKRSLFLMFSLSMVVALFVSSCQKDDAFRSEQQTDAKSTHSFREGSGALEQFFPKFELEEISFKSEKVQGVRLITVEFKDLDPVISTGNMYSVQLRDYYEESDNVFKQRHVVSSFVNVDNIAGDKKRAYLALKYDDLFSDRGTGNGELQFYIRRHIISMGMISIKKMVSIKYTEETKASFDNYTFKPKHNL